MGGLGGLVVTMVTDVPLSVQQINFEVDLGAGTTKGTSILDANYGFFSFSWALYCFAFVLAI